MDTQGADQKWQEIPAKERVQLIQFYLSSVLQPWKIPLGRTLINLPSEIVRLLGPYFSRDAITFANLKLTCKFLNTALGDFGQFIDRAYITPFVHRFINRAAKNKSVPLKVKPHRVYDEKCRYIEILYFSEIVLSRQICCKIDKFNGMILASDNMPRGYILEETPEMYVKSSGHLLSIKELKALDSKYGAKLKKMKEHHKISTQDLKGMRSFEKKRQYSEIWDETKERKKMYIRKD